MEQQSLPELAQAHLERAESAENRRSIQRIYGGGDHALRQVLIAFADGGRLAEHENPGEATLQVLVGRVRLSAGEDAWEASAGDHLVIPQQRHALDGIGPAAVLLTVVGKG